MIFKLFLLTIFLNSAISTTTYDAIIVGAGLSGLSAARRLVQSGHNNILVLEAQNRVGGRTFDVKTAKGTTLEMGGQWIGPGQTEIVKLAKQFGDDTFEMYSEGNTTYRWHGKNKRFSGDIPPVGIGAKLDLYEAQQKINSLAKKVKASAPWEGEDAEKLDGQSVGSYLESIMWTAEGKKLISMGISTVYGEDSNMIGLLDLLFSIQGSGGDINELLSGAQSTRFKKGPQILSIKMAEELGDKVKLQERVHTVQQTNGLYTVSTDGSTYNCKRLIITVPKPLINYIHFVPSLPFDFVQLLQRQPLGAVIKVNVVYSTPFWRKDRSNGQALVPSENSVFGVTFDNSPADSEEGVLVCFILGANARHYAKVSQQERKGKVLGLLADLFGKQALNAVEYHEKSWAEDPFAGGAFGVYNPPGVLFGFKNTTRLNRVGDIHFAGEAMSEDWSGYMEGAIRTGYRAAEEVAASLRH